MGARHGSHVYDARVDEWTPPNDEYPPPRADEPPLHRAARLGDEAVLRRLAAQGTALDAAFELRLDPDGRHTLATPLMVAAGSGDGANASTVRVLLELGADPRVVLNGRSALDFAATGLGWNYRPGGGADRLRTLREAGAPPPPDPDEANRMLCGAAGSGDLELLREVTRLGIDPNGLWDPVKAQAWHRRHGGGIERQEHKHLASPGVEANAGSLSLPSPYAVPIMAAARAGFADGLRLLVELGADPKLRDSSQRTALWYAGSAEVVRLLVELGLGLEDVDTYGWTPLTDVVSDGLGGLDLARWLIEAGANVNATHDRGYTVFMSAAGGMERHVEMLRLLVASGADPYAVSQLGYNAFHAAVDVNGEANAEESVRSILGYLKELGVSLTQRNHRGWTPLERAQAEGTEFEVQVLKELGA